MRTFLVSLALVGTAAAQGVSPDAYRDLRFRHIGPVGNRVIAVVGCSEI